MQIEMKDRDLIKDFQIVHVFLPPDLSLIHSDSSRHLLLVLILF